MSGFSWALEKNDKDAVSKKKKKVVALKTWEDTPDKDLLDDHPVWKWIGYGLNFFYAMACGFQTSGSLILAGVLAGPVLYFCAALLFIVTSLINFKICRVAVPAILIRMFAWNIEDNDKLYGGLAQDPVTLQKKSRWLTYALYGSIAAGLVFGALTINGAIPTFGAFAFMAGMSAAFYPLAIFFGALMFICLTFLLLKTVRRYIKAWNWASTVTVVTSCFDTFRWTVFYAKFGVKTELIKHPMTGELIEVLVESPSRIITKFQYGLTLFLWCIFLPATLVGVVMTMMTCTQQFSFFIESVLPGVALIIVQAVGYILSMGLALLAQLPFYIETAVKSAITALGMIELPDPSKATTGWEKAWMYLQIAGRLINAVGNGLISMLGALGNLLLALVGLICGSLGSLVASQDNDEKPGSRISEFFKQLSRVRYAMAMAVLKKDPNLLNSVPSDGKTHHVRIDGKVYSVGPARVVTQSEVSTKQGKTPPLQQPSSTVASATASSNAGAPRSNSSPTLPGPLPAASPSPLPSSVELSPLLPAPFSSPAEPSSGAGSSPEVDMPWSSEGAPQPSAEGTPTTPASSAASGMPHAMSPLPPSVGVPEGSEDLSLFDLSTDTSSRVGEVDKVVEKGPQVRLSTVSILSRVPTSANEGPSAGDPLTPDPIALKPQPATSSSPSTPFTPSPASPPIAATPSPVPAPQKESSQPEVKSAGIDEKLKARLEAAQIQFKTKLQEYQPQVPAGTNKADASKAGASPGKSAVSFLSKKKTLGEIQARVQCLTEVLTEIQNVLDEQPNQLKEKLATAKDRTDLGGKNQLKKQFGELHAFLEQPPTPPRSSSFLGRLSRQGTRKSQGRLSLTPASPVPTAQNGSTPSSK